MVRPQSLLATSLLGAAVGKDAPPCKRFDEIYNSGKELCENMWNDAFVYEEDESKAYTMWFFDKKNPNDAVSRNLGLLNGTHDTCHLDYYHKDTPGPEPANFTECHPWRENACCSHSTVMSANKLKEGYGAEYHWDRCGPLTPECERFFVQEACLYECDANAGLYRKFNKTVYDPRCDKYHNNYDKAHATAQKCDHNAWQMHKMPIKASYCDAWLNACKSDKFCSANGGDFFTCATHYKVVDKALLEAQQAANASKKKLADAEKDRADLKKRLDEKADGGLQPAVVAVIVVLAILAGLASCCGGYLICREKQGKPIFGKLLEDKGKSGNSPYEVDGNGATIGNGAAL